MHSVKDWFYGAGPYEGEELIKGLQETFREYLKRTVAGQTDTWIQVYGLSKDDFGPKSVERITGYEGWKTGEVYDENLQTLAISFNVRPTEYTIHLSDQQENYDININNRGQNKPHAVLTYMEAYKKIEMTKFRPTLVQATHYYTTSDRNVEADVEVWEIAKSPEVPAWRNPQEIAEYEQEQKAKAKQRKLETLERERERREYEALINAGWKKQAEVPRPFLTRIPIEVQKLRAGGYSEVTQEGNIVDVPFDDITVRIIYNTAMSLDSDSIRVYILKTYNGNIVEIPYKLYIEMKTDKEFTLSSKGMKTELLTIVNAIKEVNNIEEGIQSDEVLQLFLNEFHEVDTAALATIYRAPDRPPLPSRLTRFSPQSTYPNPTPPSD